VKFTDDLKGLLVGFRSRCSKMCCKGVLRRMFCLDKCRKKPKIEEIQDSRRASMMSKKKSLTPSVPVEVLIYSSVFVQSYAKRALRVPKPGREIQFRDR
jgi:hypothetical protein